MSQQLFSEFPLAPDVIRALGSLGFFRTTEVQNLAIMPMMNGRDVLVKSKTGSGKTLAFGAAIVHFLVEQDAVTKSFARPRALVLCPTRELAEQVSSEIRRVGRFVANLRVVTLTGGALAEKQRERLQSGAHILVGTPGRVMDFMERGEINFSETQSLVLDEADLMLDMGFVKSIDWILSKLPKKKQTLLFSATIPDEIRKLSERYQVDPVSIDAESIVSKTAIDEVFIEIDPKLRAEAIDVIIKRNSYESVLVFCATKMNCNVLANEILKRGIQALVLHSDLEQRKRTEVLARFANKSSTVLVSTDVASRGLDIKGLEVVINFDLAQSPEIHVHRIGRTGRAEKVGKVYNFVSSYSAASNNGAADSPRSSQRQRCNAISEFMNRSNVMIPYQAFLEKELEGGKPMLAKLFPKMVTLSLNVGRKSKIRKSDILGAFAGDAAIPAEAIGAIDILDSFSYVAVRRDILKGYMGALKNLRVKGIRTRMQVAEGTKEYMSD